MLLDSFYSPNPSLMPRNALAVFESFLSILFCQNKFPVFYFFSFLSNPTFSVSAFNLSYQTKEILYIFFYRSFVSSSFVISSFVAPYLFL
ncbi:hypothetical protein CW304_30030 [Bacillus sp. UFRGS-B20]|nr:hypothetical protein CW304_30030 [Bacillus sp. UFRGS-B20]